MSKTDCPLSLPFHPDRKITARFDGGRITSDAGLLLFYALDHHRISEGVSTCLKDRRDSRYVRHSLLEMIRRASASDSLRLRRLQRRPDAPP